MPTWEYLMIHHSLTKDSQTVSWNAIRKYHTETNGWKDIGYHFGLEKIGLSSGTNIIPEVDWSYEILLGRPLDLEGAHCKEGGMNHRAIGICVVGNFDTAPPAADMLDVLVHRLIIPLMLTFKIQANRIVFHREFAPYKSCPGTQFTKEMILSRIPGQVV